MLKKDNQIGGKEFKTFEEVCAWRAAGPGGGELWTHPMCTSLPTDRSGPFLPLADGSLLTADAEGLSVSYDDGATWGGTIPAKHGQNPAVASGYLLETGPGCYVMVYLDFTPGKWNFAWDREAGEPVADCRLELHAIRTLDGGTSWRDHQVLLDGYNANFFGFIRTGTGRLVLVAEHLVTNPGRWVVCSFCSDDDGATWRRSNLIDIGGHGDHDGGTEPTVAELSDGRLLMFIRTNLGQFWQAFSDDGGTYWRTIEPSGIDASSSPGQLVRLRSGKLVLVWNRRDPEDAVWPLCPPDPSLSEIAASWHREELSIAISDDDGKSWSKAVVFARLRGGQLSYPHVIERREGEIWVIPTIASRKWFNEDPISVGMGLSEADLLRELG